MQTPRVALRHLDISTFAESTSQTGATSGMLSAQEPTQGLKHCHL